MVRQAASVVLGVDPAQHQLAPGLGFRVPVGEEAVRYPARLCTSHPACGWPGWMGTGVRVGAGPSERDPGPFLGMQGWEDLAAGKSSNLTPREPQAKPLPDRRSCLGCKGSWSAPLGWPGLGQQAEEDASAGSPGAGTSPAWKESQGLPGGGLEPLHPPQALCTCRSGGRPPSRPPQDWLPLQISASDPPHLLVTLVVSASSARLSPARAKLVLRPLPWPPPPVTSTAHVVPSSASALPL